MAEESAAATFLEHLCEQLPEEAMEQIFKALRRHAGVIRSRRERQLDHPFFRAERALLEWVQSHPDLEPVTSYEDLDATTQPAWRPSHSPTMSGGG